ncbi:MAG: hypothetical protein LBG89_01990 [Rickettsiales bacterium]|nr:hypothetical protein [Rickettsiales bacterium]
MKLSKLLILPVLATMTFGAGAAPEEGEIQLIENKLREACPRKTHTFNLFGNTENADVVSVQCYTTDETAATDSECAETYDRLLSNMRAALEEIKESVSISAELTEPERLIYGSQMVYPETGGTPYCLSGVNFEITFGDGLPETYKI